MPIIYTTTELNKILSQVKTLEDMTELIDYVLINAVAIINLYGANQYNKLAFAIQEKIRSLEKLSL